MPGVMTEAVQKKAMSHISGLISQTMEEEILSLHALEPSITAQLPKLFADSVVHSSSEILGDATSEALIRCIGEDKLESPGKVYESLDTFLQGGSEVLKGAILEEFRVRVHKLYKMTMDLLPRQNSY